MSTESAASAEAPVEHWSTRAVAEHLGMAVRSVQLMVDRGELLAWKTPGGHRRIDRVSVERWLASRRSGTPTQAPPLATRIRQGHGPRVLLIEDSKHYQQLVSLLVQQRFPEVELSIADDGIAGLAMAGQIQPDVLLVDLLLPGIDGATLIMSLRSHPQFAGSRLIVVTSLDAEGLAPYRHALEGVTVIHKPNIVAELPGCLQASLSQRDRAIA